MLFVEAFHPTPFLRGRPRRVGGALIGLITLSIWPSFSTYLIMTCGRIVVPSIGAAAVSTGGVVILSSVGAGFMFSSAFKCKLGMGEKAENVGS